MRRILLVIFALAFASGAQAQNYTATAGSGLTFGAKLGSGSVLFPYFIGCDATTPTQCWSVNSSGQLSITVASGAVASGAYAPGSISAGALVAGAGVDGAFATPGAKADPPCTLPATTTTCSQVAIEKAIANAANSLLTAQTTPLNNSSVPINVSTATTTQLVALSGSTVIYVTSFDVIAGGTGNITFEYGTGTACATGTTILTGAYPLTAQAGISKGDGIGTVLKVPAGNALCVLTSAGVQMSGSVSYQQF